MSDLFPIAFGGSASDAAALASFQQAELDLILLLTHADLPIALVDANHALVRTSQRLANLWDLPEAWLQQRPQWQELVTLMVSRGRWSAEQGEQVQHLWQAQQGQASVTLKQSDGVTQELRVTFLPAGGGVIQVEESIPELRIVQPEQPPEEPCSTCWDHQQPILKTVLDFYFLYDASGIILDYHSIHLEDLYSPPENFLGKRVQDVLPPPLGERIGAAIARAESTACRTSLEYSLTLGGYDRFFESELVPLGRGRVLGIIRDITEYKQTQRALQTRETRYRTLVDEQIELICCYSPDFTLTFVNQAYCQFFHRTQDSLLGQSLLSMVLEADRRDLPLLLATLTPEAPSLVHEERAILPDGSIRWISWTERAVFDAHNQLLEFQAVGRDITEERLTLNALRESERRLATLTEAVPVSIFRTDLDGNCLYVNDRWCEITGLPLEESLGKSWMQAIHPTDRATLLLNWKQALQDTQTFCAEYRLVRPDGSISWVMGHIVAEVDEDGNQVGFVGTVTDITPQKQAKKALQQSEQLYRILIENFPNGVVLLFDSNLRYTIAGGRGLENLGLSPAAIEGKTAWEVLPEDVRYQLVPYYQRTLAGESCTLETTCGDRHYQINTLPIHNEQGEIFGGMVVSTEITSQKQLEGFLQETNSNLGIQVERQAAALNDTIDQLREEVLERRRTQKALRNSEARFRTIVENSTDGICLKDTEGRYLIINPAGARILGRSVDEVLGQRDDDLVDPHTARGIQERDRQVMRSGSIQTFEETIEVNNRQYRFLTTKCPYLSPTGELLGVIAIGRDITQIKQAEATLKQQLAAIEAATDGIGVLNSQGDYTYLNPAYASLFGYGQPGDLLGTNWRNLFPLSEVDRIEQKILPLSQQRREWQGEALGWRLDGSTFYLEISITLLEGGGMVWICRDMSLRKQAEERLRLLESVVVNANDSILITEAEPLSSPGPRIVYVNAAFTRNTGYTSEEVIGKTPRILQGPNSDRATLDRIRHALVHWEPIMVELINYRKDGSEFWAELSIVPVTDQNGWYTHWVAIQRDVSERKHLEVELRKTLDKEKDLSDLKSRFVSMTSHEFRTPLSTILSAAELLEYYGHDWTEDDRLEQLHLIQTSVHHMTQLLEDVLMIGKAEANQLVAHPSWIDLRSLCETVVTELQRGVGRQHLMEFRNRCPSLPAYIDSKLLRQILTNLLSNAFKYSPQGSVVEFEVSSVPFSDLSTIATDRPSPDEPPRTEVGDLPTLNQLVFPSPSPWVIFRISDRGIGIPPEDLPHLFDSFHRGKNVGTIQGTGLGLAIVKRCVDLMEGTIEVESEIGSKTTFTVTLPLVAQQKHPYSQ